MQPKQLSLFMLMTGFWFFTLSPGALATETAGLVPPPASAPVPVPVTVSAAPSTPPMSMAKVRNEKKFSMRAGMINYNYTESVNIELDGDLQAFAAGYREAIFREHANNWAALDLVYALGKTSYRGYYSDLYTGAQTELTAKSKDSLLDVQLKYGISTLVTERKMLDLYFGYGYWKLENKVSATGAYGREIEYHYLPMGFEFYRKLSRRFSFDFGAQYNLLMRGKVTSKLSQGNSILPNVTNIIDTGKGYSVHLGAECTFPALTIFVAAELRTWDIPDSNIKPVEVLSTPLAFYEPANKTKMTTLSLGVNF